MIVYFKTYSESEEKSTLQGIKDTASEAVNSVMNTVEGIEEKIPKMPETRFRKIVNQYKNWWNRTKSKKEEKMFALTFKSARQSNGTYKITFPNYDEGCVKHINLELWGRRYELPVYFTYDVDKPNEDYIDKHKSDIEKTLEQFLQRSQMLLNGKCKSDLIDMLIYESEGSVKKIDDIHKYVTPLYIDVNEHGGLLLVYDEYFDGEDRSIQFLDGEYINCDNRGDWF